jgi:hypothetical protein
MDPSKIPAASIDHLDLSSVVKASPVDAEEINRIGNLLAVGDENEQDFIRLCELLRKHGFAEESEELLRANVVEKGDAIHQAYTRSHGHTASDVLSRAIADFSQQLGVTLELVREPGFLRFEYLSKPDAVPNDLDPAFMRFLRNPCLVEFKYDPQGCVADVGCEAPELFYDYLLMRHSAGRWVAIAKK